MTPSIARLSAQLFSGVSYGQRPGGSASLWERETKPVWPADRSMCREFGMKIELYQKGRFTFCQKRDNGVGF